MYKYLNKRKVKNQNVLIQEGFAQHVRAIIRSDLATAYQVRYGPSNGGFILTKALQSL